MLLLHEIHTVAGGYCGMSFVEGGTVNVCFLAEERLMDGATGSQGAFDDIYQSLASAPPLTCCSGRCFVRKWIRSISSNPFIVSCCPFCAKAIC